jgi:hypothetical protein
MNEFDPDLPTLESLRERISPQKRSLLDFCWSHYVSSGQPASKRDVNHEFGTRNVEAMLKEPPRGFIRLTSDGAGDAYGVTFLGALVAREGQCLEDLLARYINALKVSYLADHTRRGFALSELAPPGEFSDEETETLGRLLSLGGDLAGAHVSSQNPDRDWYVGLWDDAESVRWIDDPVTYIRTRAVSQAASEITPAYPYNSITSFFEDRARAPDVGAHIAKESREDEAPDFSIIAEERLRAICERDWRAMRQAASVMALRKAL